MKFVILFIMVIGLKIYGEENFERDSMVRFVRDWSDYVLLNAINNETNSSRSVLVRMNLKLNLQHCGYLLACEFDKNISKKDGSDVDPEIISIIQPILLELRSLPDFVAAKKHADNNEYLKANAFVFTLYKKTQDDKKIVNQNLIKLQIKKLSEFHDNRKIDEQYFGDILFYRYNLLWRQILDSKLLNTDGFDWCGEIEDVPKKLKEIGFFSDYVKDNSNLKKDCLIKMSNGLRFSALIFITIIESSVSLNEISLYKNLYLHKVEISKKIVETHPGAILIERDVEYNKDKIRTLQLLFMETNKDRHFSQGKP